MQVNMTAAQMVAAMQNAGPMGQPFANTALQGGFMQLMMQLLGNPETAQDAEGLMQLAGKAEKGELSQEQQQNAMEMLSALLMTADPQLVQQMTASAETEVQDVLQAPLQNMPQEKAAMTEAPVQKQETAEAPVPFTVETAKVTVQPKEQTEADDLMLEGQFRNAVQKAKEIEPEKAAPKAELAGTAVTGEKAEAVQVQEPQAKAEKPELDTAHLTRELTRTVPRALAEGKQEFTMKLKPEGLGEITVRLTQDAGKTAVTIATALPETEKLIGAQLGVLQKALEPMGVTVRQESAEQLQTQQAQQQGMADQQREFLMWQQSRQNKARHSWQEPSEEIEEILADKTTAASVLDAYI